RLDIPRSAVHRARATVGYSSLILPIPTVAAATSSAPAGDSDDVLPAPPQSRRRPLLHLIRGRVCTPFGADGARSGGRAGPVCRTHERGATRRLAAGGRAQGASGGWRGAAREDGAGDRG